VTTRDTATIEIPRLPGERAERHEARVLYLTMGADRSLDAVRQKLGKSKELIERWSAADGWVEQARNYDSTLANLATRRAADSYLHDLEEHRERAGKAGKALYGVAVEMLGKLRAAPVEYTPATLATIARALTVALDIEAHALRVADLLPKLDGGGDD
jgi:hypothetical protein